MLKTKNKSIRILISCFIVLILGVISNLLVRKTTISSFSIFDATSLFTYFSVLIGFAITIYTFGLSLVSDIKEKIQSNDKFTDEQKSTMYDNIISGFGQIKGDIWVIFYSLLVIILFAIVKDMLNPFGWDIEDWKLPETVNLTLFITTTIAMWDIMQSLFNISEIKLELNKK